MSTITTTQASVHGIDALRLDGDGVSVTVTTSMGPRILGLAGPDGVNLLAELPAATIELPGLPTYRMLGGHRLWHTPEVPASTYRPDEGAVVVAGSRAVSRGKGQEWGISLYTPVIVKYRDQKTDEKIRLEDYLR